MFSGLQAATPDSKILETRSQTELRQLPLGDQSVNFSFMG